jgi:uncharacterized protein DUF2793
MPETSPRLDLPYIQPSQAQKHVTHNEALLRLDALVQMTVLAMAATVPPALPAAGDMHALGTAPLSDWAGQAGRLALWDGVSWQFIAPQEGWRCFDRGSGQAYVFEAGAWRRELSQLENLAGVGIGTTPDAVNRLAVAADASLFSHAGADHRIKVNKAAATDTASLLFQSGWTGHAEMGLAGDTAFAVKVSADGASWSEALRLDPATAEISLAPGTTVRARLNDSRLQLDVPLTGTAVQTGAEDPTAGRLMPVGAFGLGSTDAGPVSKDSGNTALGSGFYSGNGASADAATFPTPNSRYSPFLSLNRRVTAGTYGIKRIFFDGNTPVIWSSADSGATWGTPNQLYGQENMLGTVSQTAGTPTGAAIERGANANGEYVRHADGTQICWHKVTTDASAALAWSYPAAFSVAPAGWACIDAAAPIFATFANPDKTTGRIRSYRSDTRVQTAHSVFVLAMGRWF